MIIIIVIFLMKNEIMKILILKKRIFATKYSIFQKGCYLLEKNEFLIFRFVDIQLINK